MKPLEVWTCQRAENLKKSSKISKNNYAAKLVSAARRKIIGGGGGGAPINKSRRRRRSQIVGGGGAARPAHSSIGALLESYGLLHQLYADAVQAYTHCNLTRL